jgi:hypothetical protein
MESFLWKEVIHGTKDYLSPIVWASISTGKLPNKHGIEDFTLPYPSAMIATIQAQAAQGYATAQLPDIAPIRSQLWIKARSADPAKARRLGVYLNQVLIKEITLGRDWTVYDIVIPASACKFRNQLSFFYEVDAADAGKPVADFNYIRLYNQAGQEIGDVHFLRDRKAFLNGWYIPDPKDATLSSSFHLRSKAIWDILSEKRKRVGVVGWWQSWPATPVNGYLVSSHIGLQGERIKALKNEWLTAIKNLTYPESYLHEIRDQISVPERLNSEITQRFYDIGRCSCVGSTQDKIFRNFYWQDRVFEKLSLDLLERKGPFDFFAVYFRGIDSSGHQFLRFAEKPELLNECSGCDTSRLPLIVDKYYEYTDEVIGKLLRHADKNTVTMVVTDHGQALSGVKGVHRNNGFVILHGGPVRKHLMTSAHVLDVAPTVLYLLGLPVGQDMDGSVMLEAFEPQYLAQNPVSFHSTYEVLRAAGGEKQEMIDQESNKEGMEELKALGYIQQ